MVATEIGVLFSERCSGRRNCVEGRFRCRKAPLRTNIPTFNWSMAALGLISLIVIVIDDHFATGASVASEPVIYACPGNAHYYNLRPCIPTEPSQCPRGFACMLSRLIKGGKPSDQFTHLCCDSSKMNFADWLVGLQLSPQVIPRAPSASLDSVRLTNFDYNVVAPDVHMNDELQVLDFPNYVTGNVNSLRFGTLLPPQNGFLHVLLLIDASRNQCATFLNYDIPSEGSAETNISTSDGNQRFFGTVSSNAVQEQPVYRHQYVVLIFHTNRQLSQFVNITADISAYAQQIAYFLSSSSTGRALGQPIAGTFFYIISQRSPFPILATAVKPRSDKAASISLSLGCSLLIFVLVSLRSC